MFTVDQLCQLMNTTPSVKTKLAFVDIMAPRILDPREASKVIEVFPYATEKAVATDLLSARAKQLQRAGARLRHRRPAV